MKMFQINDDDLSRLEHILPQLLRDMHTQLANPLMAPRIRKQWTEVREIVSNVRWDYGPPKEVIIIPAGDAGGE